MFIKRLFLFALALTAGFVPQTRAQQNDVYGRIQIFDAHEIGKLETLLYEDASGAPLSDIPIQLRKLSHDIQTGDRVKLQVKTNSTRRQLLVQNATTPLEFESIEVLEESTNGKDFVIDGKPVELTSATVLFQSLCNDTLKYDEAHVRTSWFGNISGSLENIFQQCTLNQLLWRPSDNHITTIATIPCNGSRPEAFNPSKTYSFDFQNQCRWEELIAFEQFATDHLRSKNITSIKRLILIFPERKQCPWAGLGVVGCASRTRCTSWLQGYKTLYAPVAFHELLHNTGLLHSNRLSSTRQNIEYGDPSDPLGHGGPTDPQNSILCPNAPQAYKAGWMSPLYNLNLNTDIKNYVTLTIPVYGAQRNSFIRLVLPYVPNMPSTAPAIYISYRAKTSKFDTGIVSYLNNRIYIHEFNGTTTQPKPDPWGVAPSLLATMDTPTNLGLTFFLYDQNPANHMPIKSTYIYQNTLNITVTSKTQTNATIRICQILGNEDTFEECIDSYDNNCDGLADLDSPLCQEIFGLTPMPPPIQPLMPPSPLPPMPPPSPSPPQPPSPRPPRPVKKNRKSPPPPKLRNPPPRPSPHPPSPKPTKKRTPRRTNRI